MDWKPNTAMYATGELLYLGKWKVGGANYDSGRSRDDECKYASTCSLPGIKKLLGHFKTLEEAKQKSEQAVAHWLRGMSEITSSK